jgi:zinc transporter ZupT
VIAAMITKAARITCNCNGISVIVAGDPIIARGHLLQWKSPTVISFLLVFTLVAASSAVFGAWLTSVPDISRRIVPFSGVVLILLSLFWVLPELISTFGWASGLGLMTGGFALLLVIDRYVYSVCPVCSHTHDHDLCSNSLHGFETPLIMAAMLHGLFDGWALMAGQNGGAGALGSAISMGVAIHKLPEGLAMGVILRAAMKSRSRAVIWAVLTQSVLLVGAAMEAAMSAYLGKWWVSVLLALGGGTFLYLGFHAVHGEWKQRFGARVGAHTH